MLGPGTFHKIDYDQFKVCASCRGQGHMDHMCTLLPSYQQLEQEAMSTSSKVPLPDLRPAWVLALAVLLLHCQWFTC